MQPIHLAGLSQAELTSFVESLGEPAYRARQIFGGIPFVQIDAGDAHTCGVTEDGAVYCWGRNDDGELGDGSLYLPVRPARVAEPDSTSQ